MKVYAFEENGLTLSFSVSEEGRVALKYFGRGKREHIPEEEKEIFDDYSPIEIAVSGSGFIGQHGGKKLRGVASAALRFVRFEEKEEDKGRRITLYMHSDSLSVALHYLFSKGDAALQTYAEITALQALTVEYVSSMHIPTLFPDNAQADCNTIKAMIPHNMWHGELQWREHSLAELGLTDCHDQFTIKRLWRANTGTWSAKDSLPAGILTDGESYYQWQIESSGSWYAEVGKRKEGAYLALSGPTLYENGWALPMQKGDTFRTVTAAISLSDSLEGCVKAMTGYRRKHFAIYDADANFPAQYNGYMHSNWDEPKEERLLQQIDVVAALGLPYYIVDAGWFCKEYFWKYIGDWLHPQEPFNRPLKEIFNYARQKGVKCGLWMEIENIGAYCPYLPEVEDMLMKRRGVKICDNERYFFDFSLQKTKDYMTKVIDFVVEKYGVEYFKIDYNVDCLCGGDEHTEYVGHGLLLHNRGYLEWLESIRMRYPHILFEGCASGGMRLDYATQFAYALGNISDQIYYDKVPYIIANAAAYLVPEHTGVWSYPLENATREEIDMNFINTAFFRLQYSGPCEKLSQEQLYHVQRGIALYENLRNFMREATAFFPLGFSKFYDKTVAFGYQKEKKGYLAVYNLHGEREKRIPLNGKVHSASLYYPMDGGANCRMEGKELVVELPTECSACMIELFFA